MSEIETPAEVQYRLHNERECRRIANLIKGELPEGIGFVLLTATHGGGEGASFQSASYVSSINREDSARLLTELVDHWQQSSDIVAEPTVATMTVVRETVQAIRHNPWQRLLHGARCSVRDAEAALQMKDKRRANGFLLKLAAEALAVFERINRTEGQQ